jgi:Autographiviridae endonuclease VII
MLEKEERREARNARQRKRYAEDPVYRAKLKARRQAYYRTHKQESHERARTYREAHKQEINERARARYQARNHEINERARARYQAHKHDSASPKRRAHLKRYGISLAEYDALLAKQNGACAICRRRSTRMLCVDHCHVTGMVRGLLCHECNAALGYLKDDQASLVAALAYLGALSRDGPGSAAQRALAVHGVLPPWPTRRALLTYPPIRFDAASRERGIGEMTSGLLPTSRCVPDAVQRGALAERCTADPGPPQTVTVPGLQRSTSRCAAPGTRERSSTNNEGDDMTIDDAPPAGGKPTSPMREALDAELARASEDGQGAKAGVLQLIARKLATKALDGDLGAIKEIFDRIDGKSVAGSAPEQTAGKVEIQWKE